MDDDDISLPQRFEKQLKYMENNSEIAVLGSLFHFIKNDKIIKNNAFNSGKRNRTYMSIFHIAFFLWYVSPNSVYTERISR